MQNHINWQTVPYYDALKEYEWLDSYIESCEIKEKFANLSRTKKQILSTFPCLEDFKSFVKKSWEEYQNRRIQLIARHLEYRCYRQKTVNPFGSLEADIAHHKIGLKVEWKEVEKALELVRPFDGETVSEKQREQALSDIEDHIVDLKIRLADISPAGYFIINGCRITADSRAEFVRHWQKIQSSCNAACGPQGKDLALSPPIEKEAYKRLGIGVYIDEKKNKGPHPGSRYMGVGSKIFNR